ncbi:hypothetical protein P153DRAFT_350431 [Dothidotthia symphoricarpi CBS 119687]|uniref:Fork-head domain-containing protein n=1 Tax=Dothidotthia symphoricarpi CBS 119687 TaxID=1392245 RepID=A0A6A6A0D7_9PLEO|nr:uncharacterized protein P153DRAFT_350431 [Dothidotthia symphoricarpi CBS 119687]KAF2124427.1 hypothetical protein P153DRAFT_350431 [Dothidotthia symphoricarpi CBS 119687]
MGLDEQESMRWSTSGNFPINHISQDGTAFHVPMQFSPSSADFSHYSQNGLSYNGNYNLAYPEQFLNSSCPRSYNGLAINSLSNDMSMSESFPPGTYQFEPTKPHDPVDLADPEINGQLMQLSDDYDRHFAVGNHIKVEDHGSYHSPYDSDITRGSTPHDEPSRYPQDFGVNDDATIDKEQPYAQLIYRALMDAPNHTMILRDIYDWFKKHTDKAQDKETKGWQNSIRHNLSMNGAFEKVDQPHEEARKGFMWRLTTEAIREGVKSTTRYRSKAPNKRGTRSHHPLPQRQASGAKGGQAARRSANLRRRNRINDSAYAGTYRSVPAAFDPTFNPDMSMPYPTSPYYTSDNMSDWSHDSPLLGHTHAHAHAHNHGRGNELGMFQSQHVMHGLPLGDHGAYVPDLGPAESVFTNSPASSADEPRTPMSQGGWEEDVGLGGAPFAFDEMACRGYVG